METLMLIDISALVMEFIDSSMGMSMVLFLALY